MTLLCQPISLREPEIGALMHGTMEVLIRPLGRLAALEKFDLLWVREPFYIPAAVAYRKPTAAAAIPACRPAFAADHTPAWFAVNARQFGRRRNARELPKAWHRTHLRILGVEQLHLHDLAEADILGAGHRDRGAFAARWDEDAEFDRYRTDGPDRYDRNPEVLRILFRRVDRQLPGYDPAAARVPSRAQSRFAAPRPAEARP